MSIGDIFSVAVFYFSKRGGLAKNPPNTNFGVSAGR
jgi:hypothetical protein